MPVQQKSIIAEVVGPEEVPPGAAGESVHLDGSRIGARAGGVLAEFIPKSGRRAAQFREELLLLVREAFGEDDHHARHVVAPCDPLPFQAKELA